jgi:hypothetical protein
VKKINIILHHPEDKVSVTKVQDASNKIYIQAVEKILSKSLISACDKKKLLDQIISLDWI